MYAALLMFGACTRGFTSYSTLHGMYYDKKEHALYNNYNYDNVMLQSPPPPFSV
jgi:hypothetical protein